MSSAVMMSATLAAASSTMAGGDLYHVKKGSKKMQLRLAQMGVQVFDARDRLVTTHLYQLLSECNRHDGCVELKMKSGEAHMYTTSEGAALVIEIKQMAMALLNIQRSQRGEDEVMIGADADVADVASSSASHATAGSASTVGSGGG